MKKGCAALLLWLSALAIMAGVALICAVIEAAFFSPAHAETIVVCEKVELPGKEHTLNPFAPPEKQRQEVGHVCEQIEVRTRVRFGPITDPKHDTRAWA